MIPWITAVYGFRSAFLFIFTISVLATLCIWRWLVETEKSQATTAPKSPLVSLLTRVAVWRVALAGALLTVPLMAVLSFAPVFLTDQRHLNMALGDGGCNSGISAKVRQLGSSLRQAAAGDGRRKQWQSAGQNSFLPYYMPCN